MTSAHILSDFLRNKIQKQQNEQYQASNNSQLLRFLQDKLNQSFDSSKDDDSKIDFNSANKFMSKNFSSIDDKTTQFSASNASALKYLLGNTLGNASFDFDE